MLKLPKVLVLPTMASLFVFAGLARGEEPKTWELRGGQQWEQIKTPATTQAATDPILERIETLLDGKQAPAAKRLAVTWFKTHPKDAPFRDRALYLLGQSNFIIGERIDAFYNFDELLDVFPESKFFYPAIQRQFDIADAYLNGYERRVLWFFDVGASDEAIEMLFRIQQRSPGSPLAEKALLRTADYYYSDSQFELASDAYNAFVKSYPRSAEVPRVRLRQAFSNYAQFRGLKFDVTPIIDAREQLMAIQTQYAALAAEENLQPVIDRIDATFARKIFVTGDFYERTHELRAAAYEYKFLLKTYPNSPDAKEAKNRLDRIPPYISKSIDAPTSSGYTPATAAQHRHTLMSQFPPQPVLNYDSVPPTPRGRSFPRKLTGWFIFVFVTVCLFVLLRSKSSATPISLGEFVAQLDGGNVKSITVDKDRLRVDFVTPTVVYSTYGPVSATHGWTQLPQAAGDSWVFMEWLLQRSQNAKGNLAPRIAVEESNNLIEILIPLIPWLMIMVVVYFVVRRTAKRGGKPMRVVIVSQEAQ